MTQKNQCLVVGGLNVDLLGSVERFCGRDEAVQLKDLTISPGGHAGNCAIALTRLGVSSRLFAAIGGDVFAHIVLQALEEAAVDTNFIKQSSNVSTGLVFIPVLPNGDKALYMARGANEQLSHISYRNLSKAAQDCDAVIVFDPPQDMFPYLAEIMEMRLGIFAPGGLIGSVTREVLTPLLRSANFLILNGPESITMTKNYCFRDAAYSLAAEYKLHVVVTIGRYGCWIADPQGEVMHCSSFPSNVVDTTGAGDAFVAGFCAALLNGELPISAAQKGCAVGSLATRALGAQTALPTPVEVKELLYQHTRKGAR